MKLFHVEDSALFPLIVTLLRTSRRLHAVLDAPLEQELGLNFTEITVLRLIESGITSPGDLNRELSVPAPTISRILSRLSELGLIERSPDPQNLRRVQLGLTSAGRASRSKTRRIAEELVKQHYSHIPEPTLKKALKELEALEPYLTAVQHA